jgi:uncharacterized protein (TIGR03118 family)
MRFLGKPRQRLYRPLVERLEDRHLLSGGYAQVNLASDVPGMARALDPHLVNPWGIAFSPTGPFWFADNGSGVSDLLDGRGQAVPLVVTIPSARGSASTPTGTIFNGGPGFAIAEHGVAAPSRFLFATEDGTIFGWSAVVDPTRALRAVDNASSGGVYKGLALAADRAGHRFLYAADFSRGTIDVFDEAFRQVMRPRSFQDPNLPHGFAPFNIQDINNRLFVTYAQQDEDRHDDVAGVGHGFIDVYDTGGRLLRRFASQGPLNSPWGLAEAPAEFGPFGGALLVGNEGDGHINAYDPSTGTFLGQLADDRGIPVAIPDLWALTFGNGHVGGDTNTLFFAAGVAYDQHGLFGAIQAPERRGADTAGSGAFDPDAPGEPGDYPLPPSGGPAFRAIREDRPIPISELLPLTESSLVLVPTFSPVSQSGTRIEAPVPGAMMGGVAASGSFATAGPASNSVLFITAEGNSQHAGGTPTAALALNAFLDVNAAPNVPPTTAAGQRPDSTQRAVGGDGSLLAVGGAGAAGFLTELYAKNLESPSSAEQGPEALASPGQMDRIGAEFPSESQPEPQDELARANEGGPTPPGSAWTKTMDIIVIVSIPLIGAYWFRYEMRSRPSGAQGPAPLPVATPNVPGQLSRWPREP